MSGVRGIAAALGAALLSAALVAPAAAPAAPQRARAIVVQGEAPARANIPTAADRRAAGGRYLALDTPQAPPPGGWFATYEVRAPAAGVYRLDGVLTSPAMADRTPKGGSWFDLSVNGAPYGEVAKSEPVWAGDETPSAWGALVRAHVADVDLRKGVNTISFRVVQQRASVNPVGYVFSLDTLRLAPTRLALASASVGDPARDLGVYRGASARLRLALNGRTSRPQRVAWSVRDYFSREVASGRATIRAGARAAAVRLPRLAPGSYRVSAALGSAPRATVAGTFARLPARRPVAGPANRFAITISAPWLLPPSRLDAFARATRAAGLGYVRDETDWNVVEPSRGQFQLAAPTHVASAFRDAGVKTDDANWSLTGDLSAPAWSRSPSSGLLPDDLRDGYGFWHELSGPQGTGADALEVWNEPDVNVALGQFSRMPGDRHAAYVKAATLGITDRGERPLASLSGVADVGELQNLMLQSEAGRYADLWAFHAYGYAFRPDAPVAVPEGARANAALQRMYGFRGQLWMTESGVFQAATKGTLDLVQQRQQARYLVQSTVSDLAAGVDKLFWFDGPPYCAAGFACFGLFDDRFQPWPSYSAQAAMASLLGRADFAQRVRGLPKGVRGYVFKDGRRAITVVWSQDAPAAARVPLPGGGVRLYDAMGARRAVPAAAGPRAVRVRATRDPLYLVTGGGARLRARPTANDDRRSVGRLSAAEHVVLDQRFAAAATPNPALGGDRPQFGYRLGRTSAMTLDVYNFAAVPQTVTVTPHAWRGWSATPARQTVTVAPGGRASVPFALTAGARVRRGVDYPLVFEATADGERATPSVGRVLLLPQRGGRAGAPVPLAPWIANVSPARGSVLAHGDAVLRADVIDPISGVDPARIAVEVDGRRVAHRYDARRGRLSARLHLARGPHELWIRAYNHALAPAQLSVPVTVR